MRPAFVQDSKYLSKTLLTGLSDFSFSQTSTFSQEQNTIESLNCLQGKALKECSAQTLQRNPGEAENKTKESLLLLIKNHLQLRKCLPNRVWEFFKPRYHKPVRNIFINSLFLLKNNLPTSANTSAGNLPYFCLCLFHTTQTTLLFLSKASNFWPYNCAPGLQETVGK